MRQMKFPLRQITLHPRHLTLHLRRIKLHPWQMKLHPRQIKLPLRHLKLQMRHLKGHFRRRTALAASKTRFGPLAARRRGYSCRRRQGGATARHAARRNGRRAGGFVALSQWHDCETIGCVSRTLAPQAQGRDCSWRGQDTGQTQGRDALATLRRAAPGTLHDQRNRHEPRNPNRLTVVTKRGCAGTQRSPQIPMSAKNRSDRFAFQPPAGDAQTEGTEQHSAGDRDSLDMCR